MISLKPFPLSEIKSLTATHIEKLKTLRIDTVQGFINTFYDEDISVLKKFLDLSSQETLDILKEVFQILGSKKVDKSKECKCKCHIG